MNTTQAIDQLLSLSSALSPTDPLAAYVDLMRDMLTDRQELARTQGYGHEWAAITRSVNALRAALLQDREDRIREEAEDAP